MRVFVLTFVRLGPALVYAIGAVFAASMLLLAMYPSRPFAWALYLTMLPVLRLPLMLLSAAGMGAWELLIAFASMAIFGVYLAFHRNGFLGHASFMPMLRCLGWCLPMPLQAQQKQVAVGRHSPPVISTGHCRCLQRCSEPR